MINFPIKLIVLDVDGVLTDGKLLIGSNGSEYKNFHVKDGMGIALARYCGIKTAIITGRNSESVSIRSKELKIDYLYQGISNKLEVLDEIMNKTGIEVKEIFFMGDDINDLPLIERVGLSAAPNDAVQIIKNNVDFICNCSGGSGAVREAIEYILELQVGLDNVVKNFLDHTIKVIQ